MKNNNKKLPTAEELRFAAKTMAYRIAEKRSIDPDAICRALDTQYNHLCFVVSQDDNHAIVVYDRDPGFEFNISNRPGRLQPVITDDQTQTQNQ